MIPKITENVSTVDQSTNQSSDHYRESEQMIEEFRAHADILRRKAPRRAAQQKPVTFYSIETVAEGK